MDPSSKFVTSPSTFSYFLKLQSQRNLGVKWNETHLKSFHLHYRSLSRIEVWKRFVQLMKSAKTESVSKLLSLSPTPLSLSLLLNNNLTVLKSVRHSNFPFQKAFCKGFQIWNPNAENWDIATVVSLRKRGRSLEFCPFYRHCCGGTAYLWDARRNCTTWMRFSSAFYWWGAFDK